MSRDLVTQAERRLALAGSLGRLLLAEPGPDIADLAEAIPELRDLGDPRLAVEYERIFLRGVAPYESVFRSDDGQLGGSVAGDVADHLADIEFTEHTGGRWRVASPDHLGLELRAYAHLVNREVEAWRTDRPDEAASAIEHERRFLAEHLAAWCGFAIQALRPTAEGSPYMAVLDLVDELVAEEIDRLRPAPLLGAAPSQQDHQARVPPSRLGPARLARYLTAPGRSGIWLGADDIREAASRLGFPWRPMDGRGRLRHLVESACDAGELAALVEPWHARAQEQASWHRARAQRQPGAAALWHQWVARADATVKLLFLVASDGLEPRPEHELVVRIIGPDTQRAIHLLETAGFATAVIDEKALRCT